MSSGRSPNTGFTLIELIIVMTIIGILLSIAVPSYRNSIVQAKEAVLREDLYRFRDAIDHYHADKGKYPASLQTLVEDGYLRQIPNDPMTSTPNWEEVPAEADPDAPAGAPGIKDVRSASEAQSLTGTAYKEW